MATTFIGGGLNTYIPTTDTLATGALQVEYSRNPAAFPLNQYTQIVPVSAMEGYYLRLDPADNTRITDVNAYRWNLGDDEPTGETGGFEFASFKCERFAFPFFVPYETAKQSAWDIIAQQARVKAQLAMTHRTQRVVTAAVNTANYPSGNSFATATALGGGAWTGSTAANAYVQKGIQAALQQISKATGGAVRPGDIVLVVSPTIARTIAQTEEVQSYVKNYPSAIEFLKGSDTFARWGLPSNLFGLGGVVVEDTVVNSAKKGQAASQGYALGNQALFLSRPGGLVGAEGSASWCTLQTLAFEDMTVEAKDDPDNRRHKGRVVDNSVPVVVAGHSGIIVTNVTA